MVVRKYNGKQMHPSTIYKLIRIR